MVRGPAREPARKGTMNTTTTMSLELSWEEVLGLYEAAITVNEQKLQAVTALLAAPSKDADVLEAIEKLTRQRQILHAVEVKLYETRRG